MNFQPICHAPRLVGMIQAAFGKAVITLQVPLRQAGVYRRAAP